MDNIDSNKRYDCLFTTYQDDEVINKSYDYADYTLPAIFNRYDVESTGQRSTVNRDFQSTGARLVDTLANKLASTLFPYSQPFFRLQVTDEIKSVLKSQGVRTSDVANQLASLEDKANSYLYVNGSYSRLVEALKLLIVTGNCLLYRDLTTHSLLVYSLKQYALKRNGDETVMDIIVKERLTYEEIPDDIKEAMPSQNHKPDEVIYLYTRVKREERTVGFVYVVSQQIEGVDVGEPSEYPESICPYVPVVWNRISGENYGRGRVEDYVGDFAKLSTLSLNATLYSAEATRVIHLVSQNSTIDVDELVNAANGDYVQGDANGITAYEAGDYNKISELENILAAIKNDLSSAFMYTANQRNAERVTATEIKQNAYEADIALGGAYSVLSSNMQRPLANLLLYEVNTSYIQAAINSEVDLNIMTGTEALSRSNDINELYSAVQEVAQIVPSLTQVDNTIDPHKVIQKIFAARGVDLKQLQYTEEELKQKEAQQQALAQTAQNQGTQALTEGTVPKQTNA